MKVHIYFTDQTSYIQYNYSDIHFFGMPISRDYHIYVFGDDRYNETNEQLQYLYLGRCNMGRPTNNATAPGVEGMLSANNSDLTKWLKKNEEVYEGGNKLCAEKAMVGRRVQGLSDWAPRGFSRFALFEFNPTQEMRKSSPPNGYYYLRGVHQKAYLISGASELYQIKEFHNIWLIASSQRLNFSSLRTNKSENKTELLADDDKKDEENCKIGNPNSSNSSKSRILYCVIFL